VAKKIARDSSARMRGLRREFSEQFNSTVVAHTTGADKNDPAAQAGGRGVAVRAVKVGDLVKLKSLGRQARVERVIDPKNFEVLVGTMKMRVTESDIAEVTPMVALTPLEAARRRGGITVQTSTDSDSVPMEINVIGRTARRRRMRSRAIWIGRLWRGCRISASCMGRDGRAAADAARVSEEPSQVTSVTEPPHDQGGQGATEVELRQ